MKKSKARILLESLDKNQVLQHKKEKDFYIESVDGRYFRMYRFGGIIAVEPIEYNEAIVKHHDTRNWEVVESPSRYGFQRIVIPSTYREGLKDEDISDEFISDCLNRLRGLGEDIPNGQIEMVDVLTNGDIEVYIEC